jgi:carbonic anhydrase
MTNSNKYQQLLTNNTNWVADKLATDADYFEMLSQGQQPPFLYIGCSDSRLPIDVFTGSMPGQIFIHRNVANQVFLNDMNLLTVLEFAVKTLKVEHVIICGHYGCGGIQAGYSGTNLNIVKNWTMNIRDIAMESKKELDAIPELKDRLNRLSELNVVRQLRQLCKTSVMQDVFNTDVYPKLHGWVLDISQGLIKELPLPIDEWKEYGLVPKNYEL